MKGPSRSPDEELNMYRIKIFGAFEFVYGKQIVDTFFGHLIKFNKNNNQIFEFIKEHDLLTLLDKTERVFFPTIDLLWNEWLQSKNNF